MQERRNLRSRMVAEKNIFRIFVSFLTIQLKSG